VELVLGTILTEGCDNRVKVTLDFSQIVV